MSTSNIYLDGTISSRIVAKETVGVSVKLTSLTQRDYVKKIHQKNINNDFDRNRRVLCSLYN